MRKTARPGCLGPTAIIDSDHQSIVAYAREILEGCVDPVECSVKLFLAVRDGIRYDPYTPFYLPEHYRASSILKRGHAFCVPKASLLCALGRASGIPSRVGFATVRNHLATRQLLEFMGSDLFVYHGFVEFLLEGKWVKATPAFNAELCLRHHVPALDFNGREDAMFQAFNLENRKFIEYVEDLGTYEDIPVPAIVTAWKEAYGQERVARWIKMFEEQGGRGLHDFRNEEVVRE
jgi:transglutaminase-like putative cysteine protease